MLFFWASSGGKTHLANVGITGNLFIGHKQPKNLFHILLMAEANLVTWHLSISEQTSRNFAIGRWQTRKCVRKLK